jgi:uncharacterized protein (TIGR02246 family)
MTSDEPAVLALFTQFLDGWNAGSGEAFAAPFTDQVDFIAFDGPHLTSKQEIAVVHQELFDKWLGGTRVTGTAHVRFLGPDAAWSSRVGTPSCAASPRRLPSATRSRP